MNNKEQTIRIKKGNVIIKCDRSDLTMLDQTPDGIVINFKEGLSLNYIDQYMHISTKQIIKQSVDHMSGNLEINLDNYKTPSKIINF